MDFLDKIVGVTPRPFSLTDSKYDQSTFYGRWRYFLNLVSPSSLFVSPDYAMQCKSLLDQYKQGKATGVNDNDLWNARQIVQSTFHPDTGEPIMKFFRFSAFGPVNIPIMAGILLTKKTPLSIAFWQTVNQTYNVGFNYSNRNINSPFTTNQLIFSYFLATSTSVLVSMYLDKLIVKKAGTSVVVRTLGPATALAIAGCANLLVIRYGELFDGVKVCDKEGNFLGMSQAAAFDGLSKTFAIRFLMQYPGCFYPVLLIGGLKKLGLYPKGTAGRITMDIAIMASSIYVVIAACFSAYPQIIEADKLEPGLQSPNKFYYNRGL